MIFAGGNDFGSERGQNYTASEGQKDKIKINKKYTFYVQLNLQINSKFLSIFAQMSNLILNTKNEMLKFHPDFLKVVLLQNKDPQYQMLKNTLTLFSLVMVLSFSLKFSSITRLNETTFSNKTQITFDTSTGRFISHQNLFIYFDVKDQISNQIQQEARLEFQNTRYSYLKAILQAKLERNREKQQDQISGSSQQPQVSDDITVSEQKEYKIDFYIVECFTQKHQNQSGCQKICQSIDVASESQSLLIFFSEKSQTIEYKDNITEDRLFYFINKISQASQYGRRTIEFDTELAKMGKTFELSNKSVKQKTLTMFQTFKSYLTFDLFLFIVVFLVCPFAFGYITTKVQQRQNRKRLQKYAQNQQPSKQKYKLQPNTSAKSKQN